MIMEFLVFEKQAPTADIVFSSLKKHFRHNFGLGKAPAAENIVRFPRLKRKYTKYIELTL